MTEPTSEAYEAADRAYDAVHDIDSNLWDNRTPHDEALHAAVAAVWDLAEATVRAKVAAEIRADCHHPESGHVCRCYRLAARIAEGKGDETDGRR